MNNLLRKTALAAAVSGLAFAAHAQDTTNPTASAAPDAPAYCDTPWHSIDGNDDGFVSKSEATGMMETRFGELDADGNGEITKTEYVDCMTRTGGQTAAEADRNEQNFAEADANADGELDREEFRQAAKEAWDRNSGNISTQMKDDDSTTTAASETGNDDAMSGDQEQAGASTTGAENDALLVLRRYVWLTPDEDETTLSGMSEDEAAARSAVTFNALDKNNDDIVDTAEWSERTPQSGMNEDWASANFDKLDGDASGAITRDEYNQAQSRMLDETTTASTTAGSSGGSNDDASASTAEASSNGEAYNDDSGIPVYIYRFHTF